MAESHLDPVCDGVLGGIGPGLEDVMFMKQTAKTVGAENYRWSVGAGIPQNFGWRLWLT
jgi:hypothetical protein